MAQSRPLLIPWLREQIDSGRYPGVAWTNQECTEFSIPWKHALRQDSSGTDVLIFKAWAEASTNKVQGDPSVWKRNFRAALRIKGFKNVSDNKNDAANPHKVFRWPEAPPAEAPAPELEPEADQVGACFDAVLYFSEDSLAFTGEISPSGGQDILEQCLNGLLLGPSEERSPVLLPVTDQPINRVPESFVNFGFPMPEVGAVGEVELPGQPGHPFDGAVGVASEELLVKQMKSTMDRTMVGDTFKTEFRVSVFYRGVRVLEQLVQNEAGFTLVYSPDLSPTEPDPQSSVVFLPRLPRLADQNQANLTQTVLNSVGAGLKVGVLGSVVYGWRQGDSRAFWSLCKFDNSRTPREVSKTEPQPLYLIRDFCEGLLHFICNNGGECPPFSLFFCLGEKWPDPDNRPWEKKLITVEVVLTSLELLKMMAVQGGASSLQSVELQVSLQESLQELMDLC